MIFITGANWKYRNVVKEWSEHLDKFNYQYRIYDLGNLGHGIKGKGVEDIIVTGKNEPRKSVTLWKPCAIRDALENTDEDIVYLDAEAFVMKKIEVAFDFDIGVAGKIQKLPTPFVNRTCNCGVLFFKNNTDVKSFVDQWILNAKIANHDQPAFNVMLRTTKLKVKFLSPYYNIRIKNEDTIIYHPSGARKNGNLPNILNVMPC